MNIKKHTPASVTPTTLEAPMVTPEKPVRFKHSSSLWSFQKPRHPLRIVSLSLLALFVLLLMIMGSMAYWYVHSFSQAAGVNWQDLKQKFQAGVRLSPFEDTGGKVFLVLGLDEIKSQREGSLLTDTLLLVRVSQEGKATLLSIPRDLWIDSLKTKVNSLYYYGEESASTTGKDLVKTVIQDITGLHIDYTMVVNLETVSKLVDTLGGVDITVPSGFRDDFFPRTDVDIAVVKDPKLLYETVVFEPGRQHFDGNLAMKYIRSRHSDDSTEGNDSARNARQQLIIQSLITKTMSWEVLSNPTTTGSLYRLWREDIQTELTEEEIIGLAKVLSKQKLTFASLQLPLQNAEEEGVITHPPLQKYQLWVFEPVDPSWQSMKQWVQTHMIDE